MKICSHLTFISISHNTVLNGGSSEGGVGSMVPDRGLRFTASAPKPQHAQLHPYLAHMHERPSEDCHFENPDIIAYICMDEMI